jgi:hypothetical protein
MVPPLVGFPFKSIWMVICAGPTTKWISIDRRKLYPNCQHPFGSIPTHQNCLNPQISGERYALVIRQEFADRQFADHFTVNVFVSGTLPELQGPVHVSIPEFEETYRRERAGLIRAYSERYILLRGSGDGGGPEEEKKYRITSVGKFWTMEGNKSTLPILGPTNPLH